MRLAGFEVCAVLCLHRCVDIALHLQWYEEEIRLGRHDVPVLLTVASFAVLAASTNDLLNEPQV